MKIWNMRIFCVIGIFALAVMVSGCSGGGGEAESENAELAGIQVQRGIELVQMGKLEQGMSHFEKALKYDEKHPKAWCGMGTVYRELGKYEEAVEHYKKAIEYKPDYVICQDNLGVAYMYAGQNDEALAAYKKAVEMDPDYADVYFNIGTLYYERLDDTALAIQNYERYLVLAGNEEKKEEVRMIVVKVKEMGEAEKAE